MSISNQTPVDFSDLEDTEFWDNEAKKLKSGTGGISNEEKSKATVARYEETCKACGGSGNFYSYTGRLVGDCFKCKGTGKRKFKTSPETREAGRKAAQKRKEKLQNQLSDKKAHWVQQNPKVFSWMKESSSAGFEFAVSLMESFSRFGSLTEKQLAAAEKCMNKFEAAKKARQQEITTKAVFDSAAMADMVRAFITARENKIKYPKLRIYQFIFSAAPRSGKNAGYLYVKADDGMYLGKISPNGDFIKSRDCTEDHIKAIVEIGKDPMEHAKLHGKKYGNCACCGRELTNPDSIELGIGPVCLENWFN